MIAELFLSLLPQNDMRVGVNLGPVTDYSRDWVFLDAFKQARPWRLIKDGRLQSRTVAVNTNGNCPVLAEGEQAQTMMLTDMDGHYPKGLYDVYYKGQADIEFRGPGVEVVLSEENAGITHLQVDVQGDKGVQMIVGARSNFRDFKFIRPGFAALENQLIFHPEFVHDLQRFKYIRFLNWMRTNYNLGMEDWSNRPRMEDMQAGPLGVSIEYMAKLCNQTGNDAWICVPHAAAEPYVRQLAQLLLLKLDPSINVYVEFSNEVWNSQFPQHEWAVTNANAIGIQWPRFYARKALETWNIFEDVFDGQRDRIIRVLGGNAADIWVAQQALIEARDKVDMIAIAAYFAITPRMESQLPVGATPQQVLDLAVSTIDIRTEFMRQHKQLADLYRIRFGVYEGGQGIIGRDSWTQAAQAAQLLPDMQNATFRMMREAEDIGASVYGIFEYASSRTASSGSWGHLEYQDQAGLSPKELAVKAPKMSAVRNYMARQRAVRK